MDNEAKCVLKARYSTEKVACLRHAGGQQAVTAPHCVRGYENDVLSAHVFCPPVHKICRHESLTMTSMNGYSLCCVTIYNNLSISFVYAGENR